MKLKLGILSTRKTFASYGVATHPSTLDNQIMNCPKKQPKPILRKGSSIRLLPQSHAIWLVASFQNFRHLTPPSHGY